jgi:peptidoglycan hydrolase-like protein with peptidoglycan-binding domain
VQQLLQKAGCDPGEIDGICGTMTISAIRSFQSRVLSDPDGLIQPGKITWKSLTKGSELVSNPDCGQWSGDSSKWSQEKKLKSLTPDLRPKVAAVLEGLRNRGYQPIVFYGWRSVKVQQELVRQGNSTVRFSFHNAQLTDGTPDAYAADIVDQRYLWNEEAETSGFWKALGEEAKKQKLFWGGDWSSLRDWAHVQLLANSQLGEVRQKCGRL